jgi:hypothetical protein
VRNINTTGELLFDINNKVVKSRRMSNGDCVQEEVSLISVL